MNDPRRLREEDDLAASLFAAARRERPGARAREQTLRAMGLPLVAPAALVAAHQASASAGTAATGGAAATATAGKASIALLASWKTAALVAAATVATGGAVLRHQQLAAPAANAETVALRPTPGDVPRPVLRTGATRAAPSPTVEPPAGAAFAPARRAMARPAPRAVALSAAQPTGAPAPSLRPPPHSAPDPSSSSSSANGPVASLAPELLLIRAAQDALARGRAQDALAVALEHRRRFPSGQLVDEMTVLHVVALLRLGDRGAADALARSFLATRPSPILAERTRRLLAEATRR